MKQKYRDFSSYLLEWHFSGAGYPALRTFFQVMSYFNLVFGLDWSFSIWIDLKVFWPEFSLFSAFLKFLKIKLLIFNIFPI